MVENKENQSVPETPKIPDEITLVVVLNPKTGQMNFNTPRDPVMTLGMLDMARLQVYQLLQANQAPKIERVPAGAMPGLK